MRSKVYRIGIVLAFVWLGSASRTSAENAWTILFDGHSTDAWRGYAQKSFPSGSWVVADGALKTVVGARPVQDIITKETFRDFELELEWKVSKGGNSGVFYRVTEEYPAAWLSAPEIQVLDDAGHPDGKDPRTSAGALYALLAPNGEKSTRPVGQYNQLRLIVKGDSVQHWLNGKKILEYQLGNPALTALIAASKFGGSPGFAKSLEGHIALQHHGQEVWYRNIRIRPIS
ncbi:MAG: DUF1080 domain-containing protein [Acidobacteriota bacterium]